MMSELLGAQAGADGQAASCHCQDGGVAADVGQAFSAAGAVPSAICVRPTI